MLPLKMKLNVHVEFRAVESLLRNNPWLFVLRLRLFRLQYFMITGKLGLYSVKFNFIEDLSENFVTFLVFSQPSPTSMIDL